MSRAVACAALASLLLVPCATEAGAACVPDALVGAIGRAKRVRIVRLGPPAGRVEGRHDDAPGRFMGCPRLESFEVGGKAAGRLLDAFGRQGCYACDVAPAGSGFGGDDAGVVGVEFDGREGRARVLVKLPEGTAEVGFASGVRYRVTLTGVAHRAWWRFLHEFAGARRRTPEQFLASMLEAQRVVPSPSPPTAPEPAPASGGPAQVEMPPEAVTRVAPSYPDIARESGIQGTVLLQVLVGRDGQVQDVRVQKSIPMLDAAAIAAVRRWTFRPALSGGSPVAAWADVPVRFSLH